MELIEIDEIKNKIHTIRGVQVILDSDLAKMYGVETKVLNQAVKRNINRFPEDFMFQLSKNEYENLRSQIVTSSWGGIRKLPYVFTEHGVAMLSGVLNSEKAIEVNISIMRAFVKMRRLISRNSLVFQRLDNIEKKQLIYDEKFDRIFDLLENKEIEKKEGVFFDGQVFDAYVFICSLIKKAREEVILIDNYIDERVLKIFTKTDADVTIY